MDGSGKRYRLGLVVGRFQTLHKGHEELIRSALDVCDSVGIFIGSSQESGTEKNPFSYGLRRMMIESVFGDSVEIAPLPDIGVGNTCAWGDYVMRSAERCFGRLPDLLVSGTEGRRASWLDREKYPSAEELFIPKNIDISASRMRRYLVRGDREKWERYVSPGVASLYGVLREAALASAGHTDSSSI